MKYYTLKKQGLFREDQYCFFGKLEKDFADKQLALWDGGTLQGIYPDDPSEVKVHLNQDFPKHIKKGDYISTTKDLVMVSQAAVDEIKKHNIDERTEFWPFTLINHKGRVHSMDYRFVVPPQYDALNFEKSDIRRDGNNVVIGLRKTVLDAKKLENAPDIFRLNDTGEMVCSETLASSLAENYTNFLFTDLEII